MTLELEPYEIQQIIDSLEEPTKDRTLSMLRPMIVKKILSQTQESNDGQ
jgi:hypothetical protein